MAYKPRGSWASPILGFVAKDTPRETRTIERILAYMIASSVGLSIICFVALIIATAAIPQSDLQDVFSTGVWPIVIVLPAIGLPIGLILMIALIIVTGIRRGREAKDAGN